MNNPIFNAAILFVFSLFVYGCTGGSGGASGPDRPPSRSLVLPDSILESGFYFITPKLRDFLPNVRSACVYIAGPNDGSAELIDEDGSCVNGVSLFQIDEGLNRIPFKCGITETSSNVTRTVYVHLLLKAQADAGESRKKYQKNYTIDCSKGNSYFSSLGVVDEIEWNEAVDSNMNYEGLYSLSFLIESSDPECVIKSKKYKITRPRDNSFKNKFDSKVYDLLSIAKAKGYTVAVFDENGCNSAFASNEFGAIKVMIK